MAALNEKLRVVVVGGVAGRRIRLRHASSA